MRERAEDESLNTLGDVATEQLLDTLAYTLAMAKA